MSLLNLVSLLQRLFRLRKVCQNIFHCLLEAIYQYSLKRDIDLVLDVPIVYCALLCIDELPTGRKEPLYYVCRPQGIQIRLVGQSNLWQGDSCPSWSSIFRSLALVRPCLGFFTFLLAFIFSRFPTTLAIILVSVSCFNLTVPMREV